MKIYQLFFKNSLRNFCYILSFGKDIIFCIDPFNSKEIIEYLADEKLTGIINTHDHCDHYSGNEDLVNKYQCSVMAHKDAIVPFKSKDLADHEIIFQNKINDDAWALKAIYTPGHTLSHLCLILEKNNHPFAIFTGDCFFNAGVGNCHNGGDPEILYHTISTIFNTLPDDLLIYPGHEYLKRNLEFTMKYEPQNISAINFLKKTKDINLDESFFINTMGTEREINTFLRLGSKNLLETLDQSSENAKQVFLTLRKLRNKW